MIFEKNKDVYEQYVCPHCFYTLDKCTCKSFPQSNILWVDKGVQEAVRVLNEKGYNTIQSCESHRDTGMIYIAFSNSEEIGRSVPLPEGFDNSGHGVEYIYPRNITDKQFEELKQKQLKILVDWCKTLPTVQRRGRR